MFKLLVLLAVVAYASAGGLYSSLGSNYGYGYGYGLGGYGLGHGGSIVSYAPTVSYAPYATSYANTYKSIYPSYYSGYYPYTKRILYANPLNKLAYYSPTYLGGYAASYSPYSSYNYNLNDYYGLGGYGHGYGGYGGHGYSGYSGYGGYGGYGGYYGSLGGVSAYGHNIYNHY